ncbi:hypothetical protein YC2023_031841 [Brassica napus]
MHIYLLHCAKNHHQVAHFRFHIGLLRPEVQHCPCQYVVVFCFPTGHLQSLKLEWLG